MITKIKHLLNLDEPRFIMLGGLAGSGKSTFSCEFEKVGYKIVCPDKIRFELAKQSPGRESATLEGEVADIMEQFSVEAWKIAHLRVKEYVQKGESVLFDATNLTVKRRKQILQWGQEVKKPIIAIYLECPLDLALARNITRGTMIEYNIKGEPVCGRSVPSHVIELKALTQVLPTVREGFSEVYILHVHDEIWVMNEGKQMLCDLQQSSDILATLTEWKENNYFTMLLPGFGDCWGVSQDNKHHTLPLHLHMIEAAKYLQKESFSLFIAGLLHDVGKFITKHKYGKIMEATSIFKQGEKVEIKFVEGAGSKKYYIAKKLDWTGDRSESVLIKNVELDENAHFFNHEVIGAVIARRELSYLGFEDEILDEVYDYILFHMDLPFQRISSEKTLNNLIDRVGEKNILAIIKLREADKTASGNSDDYFEQIHQPTTEVIFNILSKRR